MNLASITFTFSVLLLLTTQVLSAQQIKPGKPGPAGSWRVIGTTEANFAADHDAIVVTGPYDNFRRLKFKVTDAPLQIVRMQITYDGGTTHKIDTRYNIPKGGESRVIDLPGGSRSIRRIDFWYDTAGIFQGRANVTIFGMK